MTDWRLILHALKGPELFGGVYLSRDLLAAWSAQPPQPVRWILKDFDGVADWARDGALPIARPASPSWRRGRTSPRRARGWA